jgi:NAD(P)-dependent dehydrogenase (short-subunit alcohol dehydrogenase family)
LIQGRCLQDRIVLITGSTDGIGKATALQLAAMGATVIVHGRNAERCQRTCDDIRAATGNPNIDCVVADLSSQKQVRQLATDIAARHDRLHVLINNAGVIADRRQITEDGLELSFAVNHLAPFLLTHLLLGVLKASVPARIVNAASTVHYNAQIKFDNLQGERRYNSVDAYKVAKLGNVLFTFELAERLKGTGVTVNALHPGVVATKLLDAGWGWTNGWTPEQGAALSVYLASSPEVETVTGAYFESRAAGGASPKAKDVKLRRQLWDVSAKLVGLTEDISATLPD